MADNNLPQNATVRGIIIAGIKSYIINTYGIDVFKNILDKMEPKNRQLLERNRIEALSFSADFLKNYAAIIAEVIPPKGNLSGMSETVRGTAHTHLNLAMTIFLKIGSPGFIVQHFPQIWKYFFNQGELFVENATGNAIEVVLKNNENYGEGVCHGSIGWMQGAIEKSGGRNVQASHTECRFHGGKKCLFKFSWE